MTRNQSTRRRWFVLAATVAFAISCGGGGGGDSTGPSGTTGPNTPTVATVSVTPAAPVLAIGATTQLSAAAATSAGAAVTGVTATWSSSAQGVATVSGSGLVTAVSAGSATITATMGGVNGSTTVTVQAAAFNPQAATALGGTQAFGTINIPAGVTVTANANLDLNVSGNSTIAGTLVGDCVRIRVTGRGAVNVTGAIRNHCGTASDDPPEIRIVGTSYSLTNARIRTSGDLTITNDTTLTAANLMQASLIATANQGTGDCQISGTTYESPPDGRNGTDGQTGGSGSSAKSTFIACRGNLSITTTAIGSGVGGRGGSGRHTASSAVAVGGNGGNAGRITLLTSGNIAFGNGVILFPGAPGYGGSASATATGVAGTATATGGNAGTYGVDGGDGPIVIRAGGIITSTEVVQLKLAQPWGGYADATGGHGRDASGGSPAGPGGSATATGGRGGAVLGRIVIATGGGASGSSFALVREPGGVGPDGGDGGDALAVPGYGGRGDVDRPAGGSGGAGSATGGAGGNSMLVDWVGARAGNGGKGGKITFQGSRGGAGFGNCVSGGAPRPGGTGGPGGTAAGSVGAGGSGLQQGTAGTIRFDDFANGGVGGDGLGAGDGGAAGLIPAGAGNATVANSFRPGADGTICPTTRLTTTWTVANDYYGHFLYVLFHTLGSLDMNRTGSAALVSGTAGSPASVVGPSPITITGASPWVTLSGTISPSGVVTATGTGEVAGYPGTQVRLNGTITNGTFTGTVIAGDQSPQTLPGGSITYNLTGPVRVP